MPAQIQPIRCAAHSLTISLLLYEQIFVTGASSVLVCESDREFFFEHGAACQWIAHHCSVVCTGLYEECNLIIL